MQKLRLKTIKFYSDSGQYTVLCLTIIQMFMFEFFPLQVYHLARSQV